MENEIIICYNKEGRIVAILPKELKPENALLTCISIKKVIYDDTINNGL